MLAVLVAMLGGLFGLGVGHFTAVAYTHGFRFDWYRHVPPADFPLLSVTLLSLLLGIGVAGFLTLFGLSLAYRDWSRTPEVERRRAERPGARSRNAHNARLLLQLGLLLPLGFAGLILLVFGGTGVRALQSSGEVEIVALATGAFTGLLAAYAAFRRTRTGLARGRISYQGSEDNVWSKIAVFAGRNAKITILTLLFITVVFGIGLTRLDTNVDVADVMPRGDPNTEAAHNLTEKFKSSFTLQVTFQLRIASPDVYEKDSRTRLPYRTTTPDRENISDEVYVRAMDELLTFAKNYVDPETEAKAPFVSSVALSDFYRLINWTVAGGRRAPDSAFALPPPDSLASEQLYANVDRGVWTAIPSTADAVISPDFHQTASLITVDPKEELSGKEIGEFALKIRDAYVDWATKTPTAYKVFTGDNAPKFSVDLPLANAHSSALASHDFRTLLPFIAAWIVVTVFLAFRNWTSIGIALSALALGVIWTFGLMGYMGIPLNTLNLTVIPLIMGVGIDYGIHTLNEYQESRSRGLSSEQTFRRLGSRGFLALFVATLNTVVGLAVMIVSPSLLIAQLGILTVIAITASFLITITYIPALLWMLPSAKAREYRPSPLMGALARVVSHYRVIALILLLVLTPLAFVTARALLQTEPFGDPPRNWLDNDPLRKEHETSIEGFYNSQTDDIKANILIFEGDINDPAVHAYMDAVEDSLEKRGVTTRLPDGSQGRVITDTLRSLPFVVRTYLTVRDGVPGAAGFLGLQELSRRNPNLESTEPYPKTREELAALLDEMNESPFRNFASLFYDHPEDRMAMMLFSVQAASYEDAAQVWAQVMGPCGQPVGCGAVAENEGARPKTLYISFFGNTAINYLFVAKELPWVGYMSVVDNVLVMLFVYVPTRLLRPTLVVGALNFVTSMWWLAVLPFLGVGLAITLTLPLVFIYAIGSDYGLHLVLSTLNSGNTEETFRTTGKAVLFSGITTFGAFLIYTQMSNLAVRRTMIATAASIPIIFLVTLLIVPLLYPTHKYRRPAEEARKAPIHDAPLSPIEAVNIEIFPPKRRKRAIIVPPPKDRSGRG